MIKLEDVENEIENFMHCKKCMKEVREREDISPREYGQLELGMTKNGELQVWCRRHESHVTSLPLLNHLKKRFQQDILKSDMV